MARELGFFFQKQEAEAGMARKAEEFRAAGSEIYVPEVPQP